MQQLFSILSLLLLGSSAWSLYASLIPRFVTDTTSVDQSIRARTPPYRFISTIMPIVRCVSITFADLNITIYKDYFRNLALLHILLEAIALWQTSSNSKVLQATGICPTGGHKRVYPRAVLPAQALIGVVSLLFGSCLRISSINKLGNFFVYEFVVQKSHTLITTGPYSVVRHPSYTGLYGISAGWLMLVTSPHTFLRECIWEKYPLLAALDVAFVGISAFGVTLWLSVFQSGPEDEMLKKKFGTIWEEWAAKTPYKILPLVY